jgi:hypothetical protein
MISLDPLYFLLLLELVLIQSALIGVLYLKGRTLKSASLKTQKKCKGSNLEHETLPGDGDSNQAKVSSADLSEQALSLTDEGERKILELGEFDNEPERLKELLDEKMEIILQQKKKIEEMDKKYVDMEKEYLILFDQSQKQEEALRAYGGSPPKLEGLDF